MRGSYDTFFDFNIVQRKASYVFLSILFVLHLGIIFIPTHTFSNEKLTADDLAFIESFKHSSLPEEVSMLKLEVFDPNKLDQVQWQALGFSQRQAQSILRYKHSLGGFKSSDQVKACYVIDSVKFKMLAPYLSFKEPKHVTNHLNPFDPNKLTQTQWEALDFSPSQAKTILRYKNSLGGFKSLSQIKACYIIDEKQFNRLSPFFRLPNPSSIKQISVSTFDPNDLNQKQWQALGFSQRQAQAILRYKTSLGKFSSLDDLARCYVINKIQFDKLAPSITFKKNYITTQDLNLVTTQQLINQGIGSHLAQRIINYRDALGGFYSLAQLYEIKIPESTFKLIEHQFVLTLSPSKIPLADTSADYLAKHPYISSELAREIIALRDDLQLQTLSDLQKIPNLPNNLYQKLAVYLFLP